MVTPVHISKQGQASPQRSNSAFAHYGAARQAALEAFSQNRRIKPLWRGLSLATDRLLQSTARDGALTLVAVGGYGRRELFPFSDVDVLLLTPSQLEPGLEQEIAGVLHALWDHQVPVSHATRNLDDTITLAAKDATVCAALMDARYIAGDRKQYLALKRRLRKEVMGHHKPRFVEAKLAERDARHVRYGDSRFLLEPNVKEGKGGLRDLQTLTWLTRFCYGAQQAQDVVREDMLSAAEWRHYRQAYLFFATVRALMHVLRGRADERLCFDLQPQIAGLLGFRGRTPEQRAERLMRRYFQFARAVGNMTRILCATLEEQQYRSIAAPHGLEDAAATLPDYVRIDHGRLNFSAVADLMQHPHQAIGLFASAQEYGLDIHPRAQLLLSRQLLRMGRKLPIDGESNRLLRSILLSPNAPDIALRRMNEMGVLAAIVPEFGRLSGQMQYDGYHTYTVDEHIIVAIGNLRQLEQGQWQSSMPLSTQLAREMNDRAVLYTAMLCHDIAKGRGGQHADKGALLARTVALRLGLTPAEAHSVGWLVQQHSLLSDTAFKRDLDEPQTIADFAAIVQSPERLRLLLLVTVADIRAVGPTIFNGWKGSLMRTLYERAMEAMGAGLLQHEHAVPDALVRAWRAAPDRAAVDITHDAFHAVTQIACLLRTEPHLFAVLAGVLSSVGASIVSARIRPLPGVEGVSYAEFQVQNQHGENFADDAKRLRDLPARIMAALAEPEALAGQLAAQRTVKAHAREVSVRAGVFIDNHGSASASVIEVNARDRIGLLHAILRTLDDCKLQVMTAHIATYGQLAVDVFYVKDTYGHKLTHHARQSQVKTALRAAIGAQPEEH